MLFRSAVCLETITRQTRGICRVAGLLPGSDRVPALHDRPMAERDRGGDPRCPGQTRHHLAQADQTDADVSKSGTRKRSALAAFQVTVE